ncbi:hypothetical protein RJT34_07134 [Clitoria ternatea]|uniref:RING-type domain-containing protein n=1 Tax=Clitoria ternatea TaxID=43366 RepID=A0AAN9K697_CLITE
MSSLIRVALAINFISSSHTFRTVTKYLTLLHTVLKWILNFIFHRLYDHHVPTSVSRERVEDCAVCLCKIGEENIITLRCQHVFHRDCLDTWVGANINATTCPLCRDSVCPRAFASDILQLDFSLIHADQIKWLR